MRLEKLSDNQIRCTLDKEDLATRGLRLSELAYGSEKAKELFHEMMQQASYEFGFDTEDLPLMIEAIPTSLGLVLVITKVEDPDELDTRFSKFSPDPLEEIYEEEDDSINMDFLEALGHSDSYMTTSEAEQEKNSEFIPLPDCLGIHTTKKETEEAAKPLPNAMKVYSFLSLSDITQAASDLAQSYRGENMVYKDTHTGKYYLVLFSSGQSTDDFVRTCNFLSEFGHLERSSYATFAYIKEHYECIIRQDALAVLSNL